MVKEEGVERTFFRIKIWGPSEPYFSSKIGAKGGGSNWAFPNTGHYPS